MHLKKILLISLIVVSLPFRALAEDKAVFLEVGVPTPYAGFLLPEGALQSLRKEVLDAEYDKASLQKSVGIYQQSEDLLNKKTSVLMEQNNKLADQLYSSQSLSTWERIGYFGLGVIITGAIGYGIYRSALLAK